MASPADNRFTLQRHPPVVPASPLPRTPESPALCQATSPGIKSPTGTRTPPRVVPPTPFELAQRAGSGPPLPKPSPGILTHKGAGPTPSPRDSPGISPRASPIPARLMNASPGPYAAANAREANPELQEKKRTPREVSFEVPEESVPLPTSRKQSRIRERINRPSYKRRREGILLSGEMHYGVEDKPAWYLCILLGFQVSRSGFFFFLGGGGGGWGLVVSSIPNAV